MYRRERLETGGSRVKCADLGFIAIILDFSCE